MIEIRFNEPIKSSELSLNNFIMPEGFTVNNITALPPFNTAILIELNQALEENQALNFTIQNISDCSDNIIEAQQITFINPAPALRDDVVINELLFNQNTGGSTFVELYNRSQKAINLRNWKFSNVRNGEIDQVREITTDNLVLNPGAYLVVTNSTQGVTNFYPSARTDRFIQIASMPTTANSGGTVVIQNAENSIIDSLVYTEDMHLALIRDVKGISLERLDPNRPTNDLSNWSSAAEAAGFATPGYINSQFFASRIPASSFTVYPEVFSPDNDGFDDVLNVSYKLDQAGYIANVTIFDPQGKEVRKLIRNEVLGTTGTFSWNGITDTNMKARTGIHIVFIEIFNLSGQVETFKKVCVVATRLNGN